MARHRYPPAEERFWANVDKNPAFFKVLLNAFLEEDTRVMQAWEAKKLAEETLRAAIERKLRKETAYALLTADDAAIAEFHEDWARSQPRVKRQYRRRAEVSA